MEVLKPWTKVELLQGDGEFTVKVWGRQYTFKDSILPVSVISLGEELLAAPMELRMDFGKGEETPYGFRYEVFEKNDDKIVITSASLCGNLIINAAVTVEYDGFMKLGIRFVPCGAHNLIRDWREKYTPEVKLAGARLVMKMKREASTLFHFWPNSVNGTLSTENISSGKFYDGKIPFKPTVWVEMRDTV